MGFYPVTPCSNNYVIGSPTFDRITLKLKQGKLFTIKAHNNSKSNIYIQSATLNGKTLTKTWLSHHEITDGGSLIFEMGPKPNLRWGAYPEDVPPPTTIN
jgi:putative alpha-1,2-mannosidase